MVKEISLPLKNSPLYVHSRLSAPCIHRNIERMRKLSAGLYIYIYMCVCVCVCVDISICKSISVTSVMFSRPSVSV
jgi:hypothetical protein